MVTSIEVKQNTDKTTHISYTVAFNGTGHQCYGNFDATVDEANAAFKGADNADMWAGFKALVLNRLKDEATSAMAGDTGD